MTLLGLILVNLRRNLMRSLLTAGGVAAALFLYCGLAGVLDTLQDSIEVGSQSRLITRNAISIIFDLPLPYRERIRAVPGVEEVSISNWVGDRDPADERGFFALFAIDAETYLRMYDKDVIVTESAPPGPVPSPEGVDPKLSAFFSERTGVIVGETLMAKKGWKLGQTVTLAGTIYPGDHTYTIQAVYRTDNKSFGEELIFLHWKYLYELSGQQANAGTYILELKDPGAAGDVALAIDALFENASARTKTETESAFQAGFVAMYGNLPVLLRFIGLAVVFAILLVAANAMMMTFRDRTREIGVMKTLGFPDTTVFVLVLAEAAILTLGGGAVGSFGARWLIVSSEFNAGGLLPPMSVHWSTVAEGMAWALVLGAVSGLIPAFLALRLPIVQALRRI